MLSLLAVSILAATPAVPPCRAGQIAVSRDDRDGDFNGMSHSGTLIMLRNRGAACRIEALPRIAFVGARGRLLPIQRNAPVGMHPGPVMVPITIPHGGVVSTPLRWVSGEVYDRSRCFSPTRIRVTLGGRAVSISGAARICGPGDKPAGFDQPPLRPGTATGA